MPAVEKDKRRYVVTIPLKTEPFQEHILEKRFEIARNIYNACLGEIIKRHKAMRHDQRWQQALRMEKGKVRNNVFKDLNKEFGVSEYDLMKFGKKMNQLFFKNIDANTGQNLASRAFKAYEKTIFGNAKKVRFKRKGELTSVQGSTNKSGIMLRNKCIKWKGLTVPVIISEKDAYLNLALEDEIKFCRVLKREEKGKTRYYTQLVMVGVPPFKKNFKPAKEGRVGIDIGTQTVAIASEKEVQLLELAPNIDNLEREKRILQRKMDRQRRANNPNKYNENGTIKKGNRDKWVESKRYLKTKSEYSEICRVIARKRELSHHELANKIVSLGNDIRVEKMNYQGLQKRSKELTINQKTGRYNSRKRFGKSIGNKAPAMLIAIIDEKLKYESEGIKKVNTYTVKASQYNHIEDNYVKKPLSQRWNYFENEPIQRDLYSAFLIMNTTEDLDLVDREQCLETYDNFKELHGKEIKRLKLDKPLISSMGI